MKSMEQKVLGGITIFNLFISIFLSKDQIINWQRSAINKKDSKKNFIKFRKIYELKIK